MSEKNNSTTDCQFISLQDDNQGNIAVTVRGNLTVAEAASLRRGLEKVAALGKNVALHGESVDKIDAAALQVFVAFARDSALRDLSVKWAAASAGLIQAATLLGLMDYMGAEAH